MRWRVATGLDYIPVILFIRVSVQRVTVINGIIHKHFQQDGKPFQCRWMCQMEDINTTTPDVAAQSVIDKN